MQEIACQGDFKVPVCRPPISCRRQCDETKPQCIQCLTRNRRCPYLEIAPSPGEKATPVGSQDAQSPDSPADKPDESLSDGHTRLDARGMTPPLRGLLIT
jgi:hypothetical protein